MRGWKRLLEYDRTAVECISEIGYIGLDSFLYLGTRDGGPKADLSLLGWKISKKVVTLTEKKKRNHEEKPCYEEEAFENMSLELKRQVKVSNIDLEVICIELRVESWISPQD